MAKRAKKRVYVSLYQEDIDYLNSICAEHGYKSFNTSLIHVIEDYKNLFKDVPAMKAELKHLNAYKDIVDDLLLVLVRRNAKEPV